MPLPITDKRKAELRQLRRKHAPIARLAIEIAQAFDETAVDNPEFAMVMLEALCRRVVAGEDGAIASLIGHLENFGKLGCLSPDQALQFSIRLLQTTLRAPATKLSAQ